MIAALKKNNNAVDACKIGSEINLYRKRKHLDNEYFLQSENEIKEKRKMGHLTTIK